MIKFRSFTDKTVLKNPLNNFAEETQTIEYRQDPLLGTWSRINISRAKRVHQAHNDASPPEDIIKSTHENCFFCKANVEQKTPEFPQDLGIGKRLKQGGAVLFPNLYPFAKYHAVCVLTENHGAVLGGITAENWEDAITGSIKYLQAVYKTDETAKFASINMNYMPPAAASIIHPHLQIICDSKPSVYQQTAYEKSRKYYEKNRKNYFEELAKTERERRIILGKNSAWLATFAPFLANDITGIFLKKSSLFELSSSDIKNMAKEISLVFGALWKLGTRSANLAIFSAPLGEKNKEFTLHARIGSRPTMQANYGSDKGFMEVLHMETVTSTIPEDVAKSINGILKPGRK